MTDASTNIKKRALTGFVVVVIFVAFVLSPLNPWVQSKLGSVLDLIVWDFWHRGTVDWRGHKIVLPAGQFKWIQSPSGSLAIVSRDSLSQMMVSFSQSASGSVNIRSLVADLCGKGNRCSQIRETTEAFGKAKVLVIDYLDSDDKLAHRSYIQIDSVGVLVDVVGDSAKSRDAGKDLVRTVLQQIGA